MWKSTRSLLCFALRVTNSTTKTNVLQTGTCLTSLKKHDANAQKVFYRKIHICSRNNGLEEFFESPDNIGLRNIKTAAPWSRDLLRLKSSEELHKLWFVLLKERNMLETMQFHYETVDEPMPSPERLEKVAESMSNLRDVLEEREKAINMLLLGRPTKAHGEYRKSSLGCTYWYKYQQRLIPKHLAEDVHGDRPADIAAFNQLLTEWHIRFQERKEKIWKRRRATLGLKWSKIQKNNPALPSRPPQWWLDRFKCKLRYGLHPEVPVHMWRKNINKRRLRRPRIYHSD